VYFMDHILFNFETNYKPELIGLCSLLIAGKYDENDPVLPYVNDLQTAYPRQFFVDEEINKCEVFVLKCLDYKVDHYTSSHFLQLFSLNGIVFTDDFIREKPNDPIEKYTIQRIYEKAKEILNYMIEEELYLRVPQIYMALSVIVLTRQIYKINSKYPTYLEQSYAVKYTDFSSYYDSIKKVYCSKNGIVLENDTTTPVTKKLTRYNTLMPYPRAEAKEILNISRDNSSSSHLADATTKPSSKVSSEAKPKSKEKKTNFLNKYLIVKENKDISINDLHKNILYKLKRPLNINLAKAKNIDLSRDKESFDLKFEAKNNRNIKRSMFDTKYLNSADLLVNSTHTGVIGHKNAKLNESKSLLLNTNDNKKDTTFLNNISKNIENIKSKLSKRLDYSSINNLSTNNNTQNVSNVSTGNTNNGLAIIKRMATKKTSFNIKTLLEINNKQLSLMTLGNSKM